MQSTLQDETTCYDSYKTIPGATAAAQMTDIGHQLHAVIHGNTPGARCSTLCAPVRGQDVKNDQQEEPSKHNGWPGMCFSDCVD